MKVEELLTQVTMIIGDPHLRHLDGDGLEVLIQCTLITPVRQILQDKIYLLFKDCGIDTIQPEELQKMVFTVLLLPMPCTTPLVEVGKFSRIELFINNKLRTALATTKFKQFKQSK